MFCPGCGLEESQSNQFCRTCGTDLRSVRFALERPDTITASAAGARDEIGRAIAAKIRETQSADELKTVAERVLPEIEKFLESPEEKRMRRVRAGTIMSFIGLGAAIAFYIAALLMGDNGVFFVAGIGVVLFFIGLSFVVNGLFFTVPGKSLPDKSNDARNQRELDLNDAQTNELLMPATESTGIFSSVTEHTTQHLKDKQPASRN